MIYRMPVPDDYSLTRGVMSRRVIGWFVDLLLLALIMVVLWVVFMLFGLLTLGLGFPLLGVLPFVPFCYHILFLAGPSSGTPGQRMMGLLVRRNDDFGQPNALQAVISTIVFYLTLATSGLLLLVALDHLPPSHAARPGERIGGGSHRRDGAIDPALRLREHPRRIAIRMSYKPPRRPQFFYTTAPLPCPYLAGRTERKVVTEITGPDADSLHDRLSRAGFRRSHNIAYAPVCPACQACVPIRIPVASFQPGRTLRRIARANGCWRGSRCRPAPRRNSSSCSSATSSRAMAKATWRP